MSWLNAHIAYWHWMVLGLLLVASEIFVPSFVLLWFGASAVAVGLIIAVVDLHFAVQLAIWAVLSCLDLFIWFKYVHPKMKNKSLAGMAREQIVAQEGMVISKGAKFGHGVMRFSVPMLGSEEWSFICNDPIEVGDKVRVEELSGNKLIVSHVESSRQAG